MRINRQIATLRAAAIGCAVVALATLGSCSVPRRMQATAAGEGGADGFAGMRISGSRTPLAIEPRGDCVLGYAPRADALMTEPAGGCPRYAGSSGLFYVDPLAPMARIGPSVRADNNLSPGALPFGVHGVGPLGWGFVESHDGMDPRSSVAGGVDEMPGWLVNAPSYWGGAPMVSLYRPFMTPGTSDPLAPALASRSPGTTEPSIDTSGISTPASGGGGPDNEVLITDEVFISDEVIITGGGGTDLTIPRLSNLIDQPNALSISEPTSLALLGMAMVALGLLRRERSEADLSDVDPPLDR